MKFQLKHPAALIINGCLVMKGVSFNACIKKAKEACGAFRTRGLDRARVNFYKGKLFSVLTAGLELVEIVPVSFLAERSFEKAPDYYEAPAAPVQAAPEPVPNLAARMVAQALGKPVPEYTEECTEECAQDDGVLFTVPVGNTDLQFTGPAWMWLATAVGLVFDIMMLAFVFSL